jgi:hypothetical protein
MLSILESQMRVVLEDLSNEQTREIPTEIIDKAVEQLREALIKQTTPRDQDFRLRMSNIGRLSCQLQQEQMGSPKERMPYNHWMRMVIGDFVEVLVRMVLELSDADISSDGDQVELKVEGSNIQGTSDIDLTIDGEQRVYDIKSASQYMFRNKWAGGFQSLYRDDEFGYIGQLYGYADAQNKKPGGWIVVDKSSGEISVVDVDATPEQENMIRLNRETVVGMITNKHPFHRVFEPEDEFFNRKPTGRTVLSKSCSWCQFKLSCFPEARRLPNPSSKAQTPTYKWYIKYSEDDENSVSEG